MNKHIGRSLRFDHERYWPEIGNIRPYFLENFLYFSCEIRLFGFLIQDKTHFLSSYKNLTECLEENKAHTKTAPEFEVKKR